MIDINRRKFLSTVGAASVMATFPSITRAMAIPAQVRSGTIKDIEHVVILMQENRSFDHYFGTLAGVRGFSDPYPAPGMARELGESSVFSQYNGTIKGPTWVQPFPLNTRQTFAHMRVEGTPHSWPDAQQAWDQGRMGKWPEAKQLHAMGYFERADIPFQFALAESFTICDAYHCSIHAGTNSNRLFLWSGTNDGAAKNGGPSIGNSHDKLPQHGGDPNPYTWTTYVERLQAAGINWAIYQDMDDNFTDNPLVGFKAFQDATNGKLGADTELMKRGLTTHTLDHLRKDVLSNNLPSVSYIIATAEGSEHPGPSSPAQGAAYTADVLDALTANPEVWSKTALFIMFDENDGFFDHMPPPAPPSHLNSKGSSYAGYSQVSTNGEYHIHHSTADESLEQELYKGRPYGLGPRVPAYVISPWSRGGFINSEVLDHTSVIRFLEARFGVYEPNISPWRRAICGDFTNAFDFQNPNNNHKLEMPDPRQDAQLAALLPERTTPSIPAEQVQPSQEPGERIQRPCVYGLDLHIKKSAEGNSLTLVFNNVGKRAAVFHVYDRMQLDLVPHRYTIKGQSEYRTNWLMNNDNCDLQIMGPEGFHRRLSGKIDSLANGDVTLILTRQQCYLIAKKPGYSVKLNNFSKKDIQLLVGKKFSVPTDINQRYDLSVTHSSKDSYLQQFAGRLAPNA